MRMVEIGSAQSTAFGWRNRDQTRGKDLDAGELLVISIHTLPQEIKQTPKKELDNECACLHHITIDSCEYERTSPSPTKLYANAAGEGAEVIGDDVGLPVPCNIGQR